MEIFLLVVSLASFLLGFFVFRNNRSNWLNRWFLIFSFTVGVWIFVNFMTGVFPNLFWIRSAYSFGSLIPATIAMWIFLLCKEKDKKIAKTVICFFSFVFFLVPYIDGLILNNVTEIYLGGYKGETGICFPLYVVYLVGSLGYLLFVLIKNYWHAEGVLKLQLKYILVGFGSVISFISIVSFLLPLLGIMNYTDLDSPSILFFLAFTAYAITRHHLMNIKVIATEIFAFAILIILFIQVFTAEGVADTIFNFLSFIVAGIFGALLLDSIKKEIRHRERIESLAQRLSNFVSFTTHELRRPIGKLKGILAMMLEGSFGQLPPEAELWLRRSYDVAIDMGHNVETFLSLNKLEIGKLELAKQKFDIQNETMNCLNDFYLKAAEKNIEISFNRNENIPIIMADRFHISHVIGNLISNAVKYTLKNGKIKIYFSLDKNKKNIIFAVEDTGVGIPEEVVPYLFGQYERGAKETKMLSEGSGIGLFLSKKLVEMHGGKIWAESEGKNKGSKFSFSIPIE